jgi:hypothetical protein
MFRTSFFILFVIIILSQCSYWQTLSTPPAKHSQPIFITDIENLRISADVAKRAYPLSYEQIMIVLYDTAAAGVVPESMIDRIYTHVHEAFTQGALIIDVLDEHHHRSDAYVEVEKNDPPIIGIYIKSKLFRKYLIPDNGGLERIQ